MVVRCVFCTPGAEEPCEVLRLMNASPALRRTRRELESRYCGSGRFISCPLFVRVERGLTEVNRLQRRGPPEPLTAGHLDEQPSS